jgi:hypothetical protein
MSIRIGDQAGLMNLNGGLTVLDLDETESLSQIVDRYAAKRTVYNNMTTVFGHALLKQPKIIALNKAMIHMEPRQQLNFVRQFLKQFRGIPNPFCKKDIEGIAGELLRPYYGFKLTFTSSANQFCCWLGGVGRYALPNPQAQDEHLRNPPPGSRVRSTGLLFEVTGDADLVRMFWKETGVIQDVYSARKGKKGDLIWQYFDPAD